MTRYCKCGHKIWVEWRWNGIDHVPVFYDDDERSSDLGRMVEECPTCGEALDRHALLAGPSGPVLMTEDEYAKYAASV